MPRLRPAPDDKEEKPVVAAAEPEIEVVTEPEIEVEVAESEVQQDDATVALHKQIEQMRESHKVQMEQATRDREAALEQARKREAQIQKITKESQGYESDSVLTGLRAAQISLEKATQDIKNAIDAGDSQAQAEAMQRQTLAAADVRDFERGKAALEERAKEPPPAEAGVDPIDTWGYPKITSDWLKNHRHLLSDSKSVNKLRFYQDQVTDEGIAPHTPKFLERMEVLMGEREAPEAEVEPKPTPKQKGPPVSAPVSRDVPNASGKRPSNGKVTLTAQEVEAARISGISPEEYAKQKIRKAEMVASGEYGEQR